MNKKKFYIISEDILTDGMKKTIQVKELLDINSTFTITKATDIVGLSRAAFYKYKDDIHKVSSKVSDIVSIILILNDQSGLLSDVLNELTLAHANILTINQGIPLGNRARVAIYIETKDMVKDIYEIINGIENIEGVIKAKLGDGGK